MAAEDCALDAGHGDGVQQRGLLNSFLAFPRGGRGEWWTDLQPLFFIDCLAASTPVRERLAQKGQVTMGC